MTKYPSFPTLCHAWRPALFAVFALAAYLATGAIDVVAMERPSDAIEIYHCGFDDKWDANFDEWPDRWTRKSGPEYAHYVNMRIRKTDDPEASRGRCFEVDLDGASAAVSSPPIRIIPRFSYLLITRLHLSGLTHSTVSLSIDFYDSTGKRLESRTQDLASQKDGWHTVAIESIDPQHESIDRAVITLKVERGLRGDLHGKVCLDDVWLARLPRITVTTNCPYNVYPDNQDVVVKCELSGIREQNPEIRFQLLDATSKALHEGSVHLVGRLIEEDTKRASDIVDGIGNSPKGYEGSTEWRPKIPHHGYYSVVVTMLSADDSGELTDEERKMDRRVIWLAVMPPLPRASHGEFGWSLPAGGCPYNDKELTGLLPNVGINWLKLPVWYGPDQPRRGDEIIRFVDMLSASNIDVVGVLDRPPAGSDFAARFGRTAGIADIFSFDASLWMPLLDPVMSRLSMRLRYWQLGADTDSSFVGFVNLSERIGELRARLFRFGQEVKFGLPWPCDAVNQIPTDATWEFEQFCPDANWSLKKFEKFVSRPRTSNRMRWIAIEPPVRADDGSSRTIAQQNADADTFVRKIISAKQHGVDGIFVCNPFNDTNGVMRANGMPAELLLPWHTCAAMLSGAEYLGTVQLPNGSENRNFLRPDGEVVMVVWNKVPTRETLYLGKNVRQLDIWGTTTELKTADNEQTVEVGTLPTFVLGVSEPITRWRMAANFEHDHVESIFGISHPNAVEFQNAFGQGVGGVISIVTASEWQDESQDATTPPQPRGPSSERWTIEPPQSKFTLAPGEKGKFPFEIRLRNAIFGQQSVRIDFKIEAEETYEFSVYRSLIIGSADLSINIHTHLDKDGALVVEQFMTNNAENPVDFKCTLRAKGQRPQRAQVYRLGAAPDRKVYRFANGASLLGQQMLLEAEEIGGQRVLKLMFIAKDEPLTEKELAAAAAAKSKRSTQLAETN